MKKLLILFSFLALAGCTKNTYKSHSSMDSIDWNGTYLGMLNTNGTDIRTVVKLNSDLTYELKQEGNTLSGNFAWSPDGGKVTLLNSLKPIHLFVGENFLRQLNEKGKKIKGDYVLAKRDDMSIVEKYWKLVELNGKPVQVSENGREPHLILKRDELKVNGNGGCNNFFGSYEINEDNLRIKFSQVAATLMACLEPNVEAEFFKVLETADNYSTDGDIMTLNRARMAPLAKFEVVYLR